MSPESDFVESLPWKRTNWKKKKVENKFFARGAHSFNSIHPVCVLLQFPLFITFHAQTPGIGTRIQSTCKYDRDNEMKHTFHGKLTSKYVLIAEFSKYRRSCLFFTAFY